MYKYILMCAAAAAVCLCVCCIIPHQDQGFSVMILKRSIDASSRSSITIYSVCSCMFLTLFFLFDGYIKLWRNCCCETNVDVGFYSYVWTSTPKDSLDEFLLSTSKYKKRTSEKLLLMLCVGWNTKYFNRSLDFFRGERNKRNLKVLCCCCLQASGSLGQYTSVYQPESQVSYCIFFSRFIKIELNCF